MKAVGVVAGGLIEKQMHTINTTPCKLSDTVRKERIIVHSTGQSGVRVDADLDIYDTSYVYIYTNNNI